MSVIVIGVTVCTIVGIAKSRKNTMPDTVGAFRIARGKGGLVEVHWKPTATLHTPWLGIDGPDSTGFSVLRSRPMTRPKDLMPSVDRNKKRRDTLLQDISSTTIKELLDLHQAPDARDWLIKHAQTQRLQLGQALEQRWQWKCTPNEVDGFINMVSSNITATVPKGRVLKVLQHHLT